MLGLKSRVGLLGLLALLLLGSYAAASAEAQGPFWYHRNNSGESGVKITKGAPEKIEGTGGEQKLKSKIPHTEEPVEITAEATEVKGTIFNNGLQAQSALEIHYLFPKITVPAAGAPCEVVIGAGNTVKLFGHVEWKWDGTTKQLTQQPQSAFQGIEWNFLPYERVQGETAEKTEQAFTNITIKGASCPAGLKIVQAPVRGSVVGEGQPGGLGEWSTKQAIKSLSGEHLQHYFNGEKNVGWKSALLLSEKPADLLGTNTVKTATQEVAVFEN